MPGGCRSGRSCSSASSTSPIPTRSVGDVHPLWTYAHVPHGYTGDATEAIIAQIERFAPGFRDRIVGLAVRSTTQMAAYNPNYVGGDIVTGAKDIRQLVFGPRTTLNPYRLGIPGMYICSAATPPGPGAHGMCGANAATEALNAPPAAELSSKQVTGLCPATTRVTGQFGAADQRRASWEAITFSVGSNQENRGSRWRRK